MNLYHKLLEIPESETPPDHYGLLGVPRFTDDAKQIHAAAVTRNTLLRSWQNSNFHREANTLMDEVAAASIVLEDPAKKAAYDTELRQRLGIATRPIVEASPGDATVTSASDVVPVKDAPSPPHGRRNLDDVVSNRGASLTEPNLSKTVSSKLGGWGVYLSVVVGVCLVALLGLTWAMRGVRPIPTAASSQTTNRVIPKPASLALSPLTRIDLQAGGRRRVELRMDRTECQGEVHVRVVGLPEWLSVLPVVISAEQTSGELELIATDSAPNATTTIRVEVTLAELRAEQPLDVVAQSFEVRRWTGSGSRITSVATAENHWVLAGSADAKLHLWDANTGDELLAIPTEGGDVRSVALSGNGQLALFGGADSKLRLWTFEKLDAVQERHGLAGHTKYITSVALSANGQLAASGSYDKTVRLWDMETGTERHQFTGHTATVTSVAMSADGQLVLSGGDDKTVRLWDVTSKQEVWDFDQMPRPERHTRSVTCVALSADRRFALSGSHDQTIKLWDLIEIAQGGGPVIFRGHTGGVTSVAISPDTRHVLSGSADRTVRLWDARSGLELRRFSGHTEFVTCVAFTSDGLRAVSGANDNTVRLWRLNLEETIKLPTAGQ